MAYSVTLGINQNGNYSTKNYTVNINRKRLWFSGCWRWTRGGDYSFVTI